MKSKISNSEHIKVAVVESDPLRWVGLRSLLEPDSDLELVSVAIGDLAALANKDVVIVMQQNGVNEIDLIDGLRLLRPEVRVLVMGTETEDEAALKVLAGGAKGYVNEAASASELAQAIRVVAKGLAWAPRRIVSQLIDRSSHLLRRGFMPDPLTVREKQVLEMLVDGRSNKEIALPLGIEERTVKSHVAKLMRKVGVQNRIQLSIHAVTRSLVMAK